MKRNIIRKNTSLNGISIERYIEIPDYDMTLQKLSTMTPYLEGRRYVYGGGNVIPTPQVDNITITRNGTEITLVPPAGYNSDDYGNNGLSAYDDGGNIHLFSIDNQISNSIIHYIIKEDGTLDDNLHGPTGDFITIFNISTNTTLQPELIDWLEAQGFTIPIE